MSNTDSKKDATPKSSAAKTAPAPKKASKKGLDPKKVLDSVRSGLDDLIGRLKGGGEVRHRDLLELRAQIPK